MKKIIQRVNEIQINAIKADLDELTKLGGELPTLIDNLKRNIDVVTSQMDALKSAGLIYATEFWRKSVTGTPKYFYLLYPQRAGTPRRREYIGCDAQRIARARAGLVRAQEYENHVFTLRSLAHRVYNVKHAMNELFYQLTGRYR